MEDLGIQFSRMAALIGDRSRSVMLWSLLDGRAFTATELSICAGISAQSASNHLSKMVEAGLLAVDKQGRHRYYRFASAEVANAVEGIAGLLPYDKLYKKIEAPAASDFTFARTCYDHLAGKLGVAITSGLLSKKIITEKDSNFGLTRSGRTWFAELGINTDELGQQKRIFIRPCLDWSERRYHLAGSLGAALLDLMLKEDWIRRIRSSRSVSLTAKGQKKLYDHLNLNIIQ